MRATINFIKGTPNAYAYNNGAVSTMLDNPFYPPGRVTTEEGYNYVLKSTTLWYFFNPP